MTPELRLLICRSAMAAKLSDVEFGPRTWRVRWPTGLVTTVREVIFPDDAE